MRGWIDQAIGMNAWDRLGHTRAQWFQLPLPLRQRWWRETDYARNDPPAALALAIADRMDNGDQRT